MPPALALGFDNIAEFVAQSLTPVSTIQKSLATEAEKCTFFGPLPLAFVPTIADSREVHFFYTSSVRVYSDSCRQFVAIVADKNLKKSATFQRVSL